MRSTAFTFILVMLLIAGLVFAGCEPAIIKKTAGGPSLTRNYDFTDFTRVQAGYAFQVDITASDTYSISITTNEEAFQYIDVHKSGDTLKIDTIGIYWPFRNLKLKAKITMPELYGLDLSGAARGDVRGFKSTRDFDLSLSGDSELEMDMETGAFECEISGASEVVGNLIATSTDVDLSGNSLIKLGGSGGDIRLESSGASMADLANFSVNNTDVDLSGASDASLHIDGRLDVHLSGASVLEYSGNATPGDFDVTGSSRVEQIE